MIGESASWNAEGAKALGGLLSKMAAKLDGVSRDGAEIASLRAQLDEARTLLADVKDHFIPFLNWAAINEIDYDVVTTCDRISALLSESKT